MSSPSGASISNDELYRYVLWRRVSRGGGGIVNFVMLNPSTADETVDDPTIRKCMEFVKTWEYQYLVVTNLFALRSPTPERLYTNPEPIGEENNWFIEEVRDLSSMVICAWGNHGLLNGRHAFVKNLIAKKKNPRVLHLNANGQPTHPLYLPITLEPQEWKVL